MTAIGGYYSSGAYPWWFALPEGSKMSKGGAELVGHRLSKRGETRHEHGRGTRREPEGSARVTVGTEGLENGRGQGSGGVHPSISIPGWLPGL